MKLTLEFTPKELAEAAFEPQSQPSISVSNSACMSESFDYEEFASRLAAEADTAMANRCQARYGKTTPPPDTMSDFEKLATLAQPIIEYLRNNHNPYCAVVITDENVRIVQTTMFVPVEEAATHEE